MRLDQWVKLQRPGAIVRLQLATGLSYTAVAKAIKHQTKPDYDTARRLSEATGGEVSINDIYMRPREPTPPPAQATKRRPKARVRKRDSQPSAAARG